VTRRSLGLRLLALVILTLLAVVWNQHSPTLFFDHQITLGESLGIFALLTFGWSGLVVGVAAEAVTVQLWGQPLHLLIGIGQLIWLKLFLDHFNGGAPNNDNGRVVPATIAYWLVLGIPLQTWLYCSQLGINPPTSLALSLKEGVTGVLSAAIALLLTILWRAWRAGRGGPPISIRGVSFATVLLAIGLPAVLISLQFSQELTRRILEGRLLRLQTVAATAGRIRGNGKPMPLTGDPGAIAFQLQDGRGTFASDPALFRRLSRDFQPEQPSRTEVPQLTLLVERRSPQQSLLRALDGYWSTSLRTTALPGALGPASVTVVQPARGLLEQINRHELLHSQLLLAGLLLGGAVLSEALGAALEQQFHAVIGGSRLPPRPGTLPSRLPSLRRSRIRELNELVQLLNNRSRQINRLSRSLSKSNSALLHSKQALEQISITDPLTGCFNRRELMRRLAVELRRASRQPTDLSCLQFDIDLFKQVNDAFGHGVGDAVLVGIAAAVRRRLRDTDCFCRSGGEEFTVLLSGCPAEEAARVAEDLRRLVASLSIPVVTLDSCHALVRTSISVGLASLTSGDDDKGDSLLRRADQALYRAKQQGRNRVEISE
jgi:diguanylate cyclase (GGDEF)-like protein